MSDEQNEKTDRATEWTMPEPVFRSSEGRTPGKQPLGESQSEIPTEPGFLNQDDVPTEPGFRPREEDETGGSTVVSVPDMRNNVPRSGGCASTLLSIVGAITLVFLVIVAALAYFLFFYRPAQTANF